MRLGNYFLNLANGVITFDLNFQVFIFWGYVHLGQGLRTLRFLRAANPRVIFIEGARGFFSGDYTIFASSLGCHPVTKIFLQSWAQMAPLSSDQKYQGMQAPAKTPGTIAFLAATASLGVSGGSCKWKYSKLLGFWTKKKQELPGVVKVFDFASWHKSASLKSFLQENLCKNTSNGQGLAFR